LVRVKVEVVVSAEDMVVEQATVVVRLLVLAWIEDWVTHQVDLAAVRMPDLRMLR
jgi:hypothetical protein